MGDPPHIPSSECTLVVIAELDVFERLPQAPHLNDERQDISATGVVTVAGDILDLTEPKVVPGYRHNRLLS
jgi:hypothetical protein